MLIKCRHSIFHAYRAVLHIKHLFCPRIIHSSAVNFFDPKRTLCLENSRSDKPLRDFANLPTYLTSKVKSVTTGSTTNFYILYAPRLAFSLCLWCYLLVSYFAEVLLFSILMLYPILCLLTLFTIQCYLCWYWYLLTAYILHSTTISLFCLFCFFKKKHSMFFFLKKWLKTNELKLSVMSILFQTYQE